jgi:hypothetical protein
MTNPLLRLAGLALLIGMVAADGSTAQAGSFGANLNIRTSSQSFPQTVYAGGGRPQTAGPSVTPPPYNYGRPGPRVHVYNRDTQFDDVTDASTHGLVK